MELNLSKQAVGASELVYEGSLEQPIESDVLLPDYCPDIVKILRCFVDTVVSGTQISGNRLTVDMSCIVKIYYLGADNTVRCSEQKLPYTKSAEIGATAQNPVTFAQPRTDYVNCRAVNQRRFEVRAAISLWCRVLSRYVAETVSGASGCGIQLKTTEKRLTELVGDYTSRFSLHEDLELSAGKPAIQSVILSECTLRLLEAKPIFGKVVLKGEMHLSVLYQPDGEGCPQRMEYTLPLSQIADGEGITDESICDVCLTVERCELVPKVDAGGECRLLAMDCLLKCRILSHRHQSITLIEDCYCTACQCSAQREPISTLCLQKLLQESCLQKGEITPSAPECTIGDMFCRVAGITTESGEGGLTIKASLLICMFECSPQGVVSYREESGECSYTLPMEPGQTLFCLPRALPGRCEYTRGPGGGVEYRCEVTMEGPVYALEHPQAVVGITTAPAEKQDRWEDASLIVYYATEGEELWDIAKRYNTSLYQIMGENQLEEETITQRQMLLVPIV